jgi:hypothetical protein
MEITQPMMSTTGLMMIMATNASSKIVSSILPP